MDLLSLEETLDKVAKANVLRCIGICLGGKMVIGREELQIFKLLEEEGLRTNDVVEQASRRTYQIE